MAKYLVDTSQRRDVVMLYSARTAQDVAYGPVFEDARRAIGMKTFYVLNGEPATTKRPYVYGGTRITTVVLASAVPDYLERLFYVSGTHTMVSDIKQQLIELGVPRRQIKIDFFPGYA